MYPQLISSRSLVARCYQMRQTQQLGFLQLLLTKESLQARVRHNWFRLHFCYNPAGLKQGTVTDWHSNCPLYLDVEVVFSWDQQLELEHVYETMEEGELHTYCIHLARLLVHQLYEQVVAVNSWRSQLYIASDILLSNYIFHRARDEHRRVT